MNLYLISQDENTGYDTYDSVVVVAETIEQAQVCDPSRGAYSSTAYLSGMWAHPSKIRVSFLGVCGAPYKAGDVVCASFNAG